MDIILCGPGAIAAVSDVEIVTKCANDLVGRCYKIDKKGDITSVTNQSSPTGR